MWGFVVLILLFFHICTYQVPSKEPGIILFLYLHNL